MEASQPLLRGGVGSGDWKHLDPRQVRYLRLAWGLRVAVEAVAWALLTRVAHADGWLTPAFRALLASLLGGAVLLDGILAVLLPPLRWRYAAWRVDPQAVEILTGVWWRRGVTIPRTRLQHLDVVQGPLQRRFGLATLVLHTAGTADASVPLAGLAHQVALALRAELAAGPRPGDGV